MKPRLLFVAAVAPLLAVTGCLAVRTYSTVDPIHVTLDVNLKVKLDRELQDAFGDIDAVSKTIRTP